MTPTQPNTVRLKVAYKTPQRLLGEFTRSVGKGGVALESKKNLPIGTRFVFELHATGLTLPVEVLGEVVKTSPGGKGKYLVSIRYDQGSNRKGLDALLKGILDAHKADSIRKFPRIPLQLRGAAESPSPAYVVRDVSRTGAGIEVEAASLPDGLHVSAPFLIELSLTTGSLALHGEVVWVFAPPPQKAKPVHPLFGVAFGKLRPSTLEGLDKLLTLKGLPPPPWKARVSFGLDAVARMP